jgi:hypothetical protein
MVRFSILWLLEDTIFTTGVITKEYKRINWNIWCGKWSYMANNHLLGQTEIDHGNS